MPTEYANLIPIIILIAGYILTQTTENKRVEVAEQMLYEKFDEGTPDPASEYNNEDYPIVGDDEDAH